MWAESGFFVQQTCLQAASALGASRVKTESLVTVLYAAFCSVTLSNLLSLTCSFIFHSPLWQRFPQRHWLCLWKQYPFLSSFVCLNLFLPTITGCPSVLLFWGFLCSTSLCCLGIYRLLLYLPLTYLFSKLENIRLRILSCVSCSLFLIGMGNKETDVKKQLITTGEYRGSWAWALAFLF